MTVIAIDIGGESGRVIGVSYDGKTFQLNELHRFPNIPSKINGTLYWDILQLWSEIKFGIEKGRLLKPSCIGVDTWGVDFVLLDAQDNLLSNPVHYRDNRTDGMMEKVFAKIPKEEIFKQTGIQFIPINTLFQMMSLVENNSPILSTAKTFLTIPDLLNFWLTGIKVCEFTNATTTQMYNPLIKEWAKPILEKLHIPVHIFPKVVLPGKKLGQYKSTDVIAVASHDTGSAVAAIPVQVENYAYISSGTWSLVGLEVTSPLINKAALQVNITNEGGVYGTFRLLKNVIGLWIIQECCRAWQSEGKNYTYDELINLANLEQPLRSFIFPDDPVFLHHGNHPQFIKEFCMMTAQPIPETPGAIIRCVLDSLALTYKDVLIKLLKISGRKTEVVHIVGGGSKNKLLNQLTSNAIGLPVLAGPAEATIIGNATVQLISIGEIGNIQDARQIVSNMTGIKRYEPKNTAIWEEAYEHYSSLQKQN